MQLSTFNTYLADEYRLVKMKERLFIKLGTVISQRDITVVHNIYTKLGKYVEQAHNNKVVAEFIKEQEG